MLKYKKINFNNLIPILIFAIPYLFFINENNLIMLTFNDYLQLIFYFFLTVFIFFFISVLLFFIFKKYIDNIFIKFFLFFSVFYYQQFFYENINSLIFDIIYSNFAGYILLLVFNFLTFIIVFKFYNFFRIFSIFFIILSFIFFTWNFFNYFKKYNNIQIENEIFLDNKFSFNNNSNSNIYYIVPDKMINHEIAEKKYDLDMNKFLQFIHKNKLNLINNAQSVNLNTHTTLTKLMYLEDLKFSGDITKTNRKIFYPNIMKSEDLPIYKILKDNNYTFYWVGNIYALCSKYLNQNTHRRCISNEQKSELFFTFFKDTPFLRILDKLNFINYDFFKINDGIGRLTKFIESKEYKNSNSFFFVHHMSPHRPYIFSESCHNIFDINDYERDTFDINKYIDQYKCNLIKIENLISKILKYDQNAVVVIQADHGFDSLNNKIFQSKRVFSLYMFPEKCINKFKEKKNNLDTIESIKFAIECALI